MDEFGMPKTKSLLAKYDGEIDGEKRDSFVLGKEGDEEARFKNAMKEKLKQQQKRIETLESRPLQIASEYYTADEMTAFKKPKRRVKKIRTKEILTADDLLKTVPVADASSDLGSRSKKRKTESTAEPSESTEDLSNVKIEVDESNLEVKIAMEKARRLKQKKANLKHWNPEEIARSIKREPMDNNDQDAMEVTPDDVGRSSIVLNATAEFCRTLGDIPTYGMAGNRDEDEDELLVCLTKSRNNSSTNNNVSSFQIRISSGSWRKRGDEITRRRRKSERRNVYRSAAAGMFWSGMQTMDPTKTWMSIAATKVD